MKNVVSKTTKVAIKANGKTYVCVDRNRWQLAQLYITVVCSLLFVVIGIISIRPICKMIVFIGGGN